VPRTAKSNTPSLHIRVRVTRGGDFAFGPGKAQVLESLLETNSLNRTASAMKMSYVKALALVHTMNAHFSKPLVLLSRGGTRGGGAQVTDTGRKVLSGYLAMQAASETAALKGWKKLQRFLKG
jgi:molybdate transport system regulatory protein